MANPEKLSLEDAQNEAHKIKETANKYEVDYDHAETKSSIIDQFENPDVLDLAGEKVEVIDIRPEKEKTDVPVVVAPGWVATPKTFKENIIGFAELNRRVISINSPHGIDAAKKENLPQAELRNVAALMETLKSKGIEKIDAVGHSEAGIYLTIAATLHPEKFRNIILINPGGMIGDDKASSLSIRFSMDIISQIINNLKAKDKKRFEQNSIATKEFIKALKDNPKMALKEILAISSIQIHDMLKDLKKKGIGISIIHGVDDKAFPMERVQQMAKKDQLDGFYSVKGGHNEIYLNPGVYTKLADKALDDLEAKYKK